MLECSRLSLIYLLSIRGSFLVSSAVVVVIALLFDSRAQIMSSPSNLLVTAVYCISVSRVSVVMNCNILASRVTIYGDLG